MPETALLVSGQDESALQAEVIRLNKIIRALMNRAERGADIQGSDFNLFQTAVLLEDQIRHRTRALEAALRENEKINRALRRTQVRMELEIQERKRAQETSQDLQAQLREEAIRDPLTGLYNRRYLNETFVRELLRAERYGRPVSVIMGDIDHFKDINDIYGHPAGDEVLRVFSNLLKLNARGGDICCRYGGEEFLLLLSDMPAEGACQRAEQLRQAFSEARIAWGGFVIQATASFGVATYPRHGTTCDELIAAADIGLYIAKSAGRNRVKPCAARREPDAATSAAAGN